MFHHLLRRKHWFLVSCLDLAGPFPWELTEKALWVTAGERYHGESCCPTGLSRLALPWSCSLLTTDKELHAVCECTFTRPHHVFSFSWLFPNPHIALRMCHNLLREANKVFWRSCACLLDRCDGVTLNNTMRLRYKPSERMTRVYVFVILVPFYTNGWRKSRIYLKKKAWKQFFIQKGLVKNPSKRLSIIISRFN